MHGINRVILAGELDKSGVTVKYAPNGTPYASFVLVVSEHGQDGKVHSIFVDCECLGKRAAAASEIAAGALVLFEGRLAKRKRGALWAMVVAGFDLLPLTAPGATLTGSAPAPEARSTAHG